jgi:glycosyltransferase involved in cell wall biosynthesis
MNENGITENVRLIYNGVEKINTKSHGKSIGFIGRLTEEKGIFDFIRENTGLLTSQSMVVAGDGPLLDDIKNFVSENKLNIKILGNISDKVSFYEQISVLVLPSRTEVMPLVVLEAYSCGLPVVAFDIAPLRKLISSNNGMLVENNNYQQMGEAAIGLIDITSQFKNNIDLFNEKYSADIMWQATSELYHELIKKR